MLFTELVCHSRIEEAGLSFEQTGHEQILKADLCALYIRWEKGSLHTARHDSQLVVQATCHAGPRCTPLCS